MTTTSELLTDADAETAIALTIGAASMCWAPPPTGEFDSAAAAELVDRLLAHLRELRLVQ